jgi:hypothetical protein
MAPWIIPVALTALQIAGKAFGNKNKKKQAQYERDLYDQRRLDERDRQEQQRASNKANRSRRSGLASTFLQNVKGPTGGGIGNREATALALQAFGESDEPLPPPFRPTPVAPTPSLWSSMFGGDGEDSAFGPALQYSAARSANRAAESRQAASDAFLKSLFERIFGGGGGAGGGFGGGAGAGGGFSPGDYPYE